MPKRNLPILFTVCWLLVPSGNDQISARVHNQEPATGGIGVAFDLEPKDYELKGYVVQGVAPGGPADRVGGIRDGDVIIAVNGRLVSTMEPEEFVSTIRGAVGSRVELTFYSTQDARLRTAQLVRADMAALARAMPEQAQQSGPVGSAADVVGDWRVYSSRLFYDQGGGGAVNTMVPGILEIRRDGMWSYSSSQGKWSVAPISEEDWKRWDVSPYGPKRKLVLTGWNNSTADGPIEESNRVDFLWVLYRVGPPTVGAPGTVHMKFGRQNP